MDHHECQRPTIICGPSGVGKDTIINALTEHFDDTFGVSVSHTTRKPRDGEHHGVHYHFVNHERFERKADFMEITEYAGNKYGTSYEAVKEVAKNGLICLMNVHYSAAQKIEHQRPGWCHFVFISVTGRLSTLRERLEDRGESSDAIGKRLQKAKEEFDFVDNHSQFFDEVIPNDGEIEDAVDALAKALGSWYSQFEKKRLDRKRGSNGLMDTPLQRNKYNIPSLEFARNQSMLQSWICGNFGAAWFLLCDVTDATDVICPFTTIRRGSNAHSPPTTPQHEFQRIAFSPESVSDDSLNVTSSVPDLPDLDSLSPLTDFDLNVTSVTPNNQFESYTLSGLSPFVGIGEVDPITTSTSSVMGGYQGNHFGFNDFHRSSPLFGYDQPQSPFKH